MPYSDAHSAKPQEQNLLRNLAGPFRPALSLADENVPIASLVPSATITKYDPISHTAQSNWIMVPSLRIVRERPVGNTPSVYLRSPRPGYPLPDVDLRQSRLCPGVKPALYPGRLGAEQSAGRNPTRSEFGWVPFEALHDSTASASRQRETSRPTARLRRPRPARPHSLLRSAVRGIPGRS